MEPTAPIKYNQVSARLKQHIAEWEAEKSIGQDEALVFEIMGAGDSAEVAYKSTYDVDSMLDAVKAKPVGKQTTVNGETVVDPGTEDYIHLMYFKGGFAPGKKKTSIWFEGKDALTVVVRKKANPALYQYLILSNYCEDNANPARVAPDGGCVYRLLRPTLAVESAFEDRLALAGVIQQIGTADRATLLALAPKLRLPHAPDTSVATLRQDFADYAGKQRGWHKLATLFASDDTLFLAAVEKAVALDVVVVDAERAMWVFNGTKELICPASPTQGTTRQLVDFLLVQEGQVAFKQIVALTDAAARAAKKK